MSETGPAGRARWEIWFTPARVVTVTVLASIPVKMLAGKLVDPDLWWHLKTGELIVTNGALPRTDPFSFTAGGEPWVVQEWGAEVLFRGIVNAFGLFGILVFAAAMLLAIYAVVARLLVRRMGGGMGTWALLALTAYAGASNWTERPNLLSFLFFALTLDLLERRGRSLWWFVPLAALWANVHGMVILGLGLLAIVAATEWLKVALRWEGAERAWASRLGLVTVAGVGASFVNPYGPGLHLHAFRLIRIVSGFVSEWASPNFHTSGPQVFLGLLLMTIAAMALSPGRPDPADVALALAFTAIALNAGRNLAVSSIVLGLVCARYAPGALASIPRRERAHPRPDARPSVLLGGTALVVALGALGLVLADGLPRSGAVADIVDDEYPIVAIDALDRPGVRVFAHDGWAPMVIYRAWPNARVYIDLRWDFYGPELSDRYGETITASPDWAEHLDSECTTHVLVRPAESLAQVLRLSPEWRAEREDENTVTFARRAPAPGCATHPIPA